MTGGRAHWRFVAPGLLVAPLLLFGPFLVHGQLIYGWDSAGGFDFWRTWAFGWLRQGVLPLYNPHVLSGYPLLLDPQHAPFYPPNWLHGWLPFHRALSLNGLLHTVWAGTGVYAAARLLHARPLPALAAAVSWQACSLFVGQFAMGTPTQHCTLAWGGWVLFMTERLLRTPERRTAALWALTTALMFLAGQTQFALYLLYTAAVFATARLLGEPPLRRPALARHTVLALGLVAGVLAAQGLMAAHLSAMSLGRHGVTDNTSMVVLNLAGLFLPTVFGEELHRYYWGVGVMNMWVPFVGVFWPWLWLSRGRRAFADPFAGPLLLALLFTLTMAVGFPHAPAMVGFDVLPLLSFFRAPVRWLAVACLVGVTGGAVVWTRLQEEGTLRLNPWWLCLPGGAVGLGLVTLAAPGASQALLHAVLMKGQFTVADIVPPPPALLRQIPWDLITAGAGSLGVMGLTLMLLHRQRPLARAALFLVITAPVVWVGQRFLVPVAPERFHFSETVAAKLKSATHGGRLATLTPAASMPLPRWAAVNYRWNNQYAQSHQHAGVPHGVANIGGYVSMPHTRYHELMLGRHPETGRVLEFDWNFPTWQWQLDLMGVTALALPRLEPGAPPPPWCTPRPRRRSPAGQSVHPHRFCTPAPGGDLHGWTPLLAAGPFHLFHNHGAFPPAWPVRRVMQVRPASSLATAQSLAGRLRHTAVLTAPTDLPTDTGVTAPGETARRIPGATPNTFTLKTDLAARRLVVLSLPFDTAWRATLNGRPVPVLRADHALSAVVVPPGQQSLTFRYRPRGLTAALVQSALALVLCVALAAAPSRNQ